ncbi:MAG: hypothetical protein ABWX96_21880 [Propionibacteriaceae bacterium]
MMIDKNVRLILGALTGVVSLIAMIRLVAGAYSDHLSTFAWVFILLAMVPWIGYTALRSRHANLTSRAALAVLGLAVLGLLSVWLFTLGAVIALACSLGAFVVIWVHDWPNRRTSAGDHFVRIEDLATDERD